MTYHRKHSLIAGTKMNRASDWYDDITKDPTLWNDVPVNNQDESFMFGMNALPYVGEAKKALHSSHYLSTGLKMIPLVVPE